MGESTSEPISRRKFLQITGVGTGAGILAFLGFKNKSLQGETPIAPTSEVPSPEADRELVNRLIAEATLIEENKPGVPQGVLASTTGAHLKPEKFPQLDSIAKDGDKADHAIWEAGYMGRDANGYLVRSEWLGRSFNPSEVAGHSVDVYVSLETPPSGSKFKPSFPHDLHVRTETDQGKGVVTAEMIDFSVDSERKIVTHALEDGRSLNRPVVISTPAEAAECISTFFANAPSVETWERVEEPSRPGVVHYYQSATHFGNVRSLPVAEDGRGRESHFGSVATFKVSPQGDVTAEYNHLFYPSSSE